ncbi:hypothetical protein Tco_0563641 [Tanacetum coccineum]
MNTLLASLALRHLNIYPLKCGFATFIIPKTPWDFPALTTLHLYDTRLGDDADESVDLFSNCLNLENLVIESSSIRAKNKSVAATFKVCITKYQDLEKGLVRVSDDRLLSYMFDVEERFGRLNLYLDYLDMNLLEYLSQAITYDIDACAEMEVEKPDGVVTSTSNIDKGIDATDPVEARTSTTDKQGEYQSDKSADYLSPGEKELIELRNRMTANTEAKAKPKDNPVSEMNEPNNKNSMPANNVRGETFEEHDIYMNRLLKSLNIADKDGITEDPFISVGEKYISVAQFKECRTYYALANGFSLWYEMSGKVRVVSKCGQRPLRLSDPEKDSNPGSTVNLGVTGNPDGKTYFNRFYVCFAGLADGWKAWCRKIIALEGCFLKSPNQCEILTAIGRDGNNHIYPVVNVENKNNWTWFLELLE